MFRNFRNVPTCSGRIRGRSIPSRTKTNKFNVVLLGEPSMKNIAKHRYYFKQDHPKLCRVTPVEMALNLTASEMRTRLFEEYKEFLPNENAFQFHLMNNKKELKALTIEYCTPRSLKAIQREGIDGGFKRSSLYLLPNEKLAALSGEVPANTENENSQSGGSGGSREVPANTENENSQDSQSGGSGGSGEVPTEINENFISGPPNEVLVSTPMMPTPPGRYINIQDESHIYVRQGWAAQSEDDQEQLPSIDYVSRATTTGLRALEREANEGVVSVCPNFTNKQDNKVMRPDIHAEDRESLQEYMMRLSSLVSQGETKTIINTSRYNTMESLLWKMKSKAFNPCRQLNVRFVGEMGIDNGGLTREFFNSILRKIRTSRVILYETQRGCMLRRDAKAEENMLYRGIGRILAMMLLHNAVLPQIFSMRALAMMTKTAFHPDIEDLPKGSDMEIFINKIIECKSQLEYTNVRLEYWGLLEASGTDHMAISLDEKLILSDHLIKYFVVDRTVACYTQLMDGLNDVIKIGDDICQNHNLREAFVKTSKKCSVSDFNGWDVKYSTNTVKKQREEVAISHWEMFLETMEEENLLPDVLRFCTGQESPPVIQFSPNPSIEFLHKDNMANINKCKSELPQADTCGLILRLPLLDSVETFIINFRNSIQLCLEFGVH